VALSFISYSVGSLRSIDSGHTARPRCQSAGADRLQQGPLEADASLNEVDRNGNAAALYSGSYFLHD